MPAVGRPALVPAVPVSPVPVPAVSAVSPVAGSSGPAAVPSSMAALEQAFSVQRDASRAESYPSLEVRRDRLTRLIDLLCAHQDALCAAVAEDFGVRSVLSTKLFDILPPVSALKYAREHLAEWMRPQRRRSSFPYNLIGARSSVRHVPLGVVGNISPWNFPLTLALSPLGGMLAAGNRVMIKPSELTPRTSQTLKDLIARTFGADEIHVVTGGPEVAAAFSALPFDHLLFTGSTAVGRRVAEAAAPHLVPVTLELGGKCPVIVSDSADLAQAAAKVMFAKTTNAGQICLAPDYVLVSRARREAFVRELQRSAAALYPSGLASPDYANVITQRHVQRLRAHLEDAALRGNRVIPLFGSGGGAGSGGADPRRLEPSLVLIEADGGTLMEEEIFGPILPVVAVEDLSGALRQVASRSRPLAVYYFGSDRREIERLTTEIVCGGLVVNDLMMHFLQDDLPFGGVGDSGMGSYHAEEGFRRFSHATAVFEQSRWIDVGWLLRPPYGERITKLLKMRIKS
jgi:coniferyl-aldehyde dehydrogenase